MSNLALLLQEQGKGAEAEALLRETLTARISALGASHPDTRDNLLVLCALLSAQGRAGEARELQAQCGTGSAPAKRAP
jgi:hypothetical protein